MQNFSLPYIYSVVLLIVICSAPLKAQDDEITLTVINEETQEPVPFATISFPELQYGFSTNANGQFRLNINPTMAPRKIVISSIGFEPYESTLGQLQKSKDRSILLNPKVIVLEEILIKAEAETPQDIIKSAEKNLKTFLGQDPYYLFAFYKEVIKRNNEYAGYTEAYGVFHISGYHPVYNRKNRLFSYDLAQWKNIRRSKYLLNSECDDSKPRLLEIDKVVKAKSEYLYNGPFSKLRSEFRFTIDSVTSYQGQDVFIIGFTPSQSDQVSYRGSAYVKADDYALLKLEIWEQDAGRIFYDDCKIPQVTAHFSINYVKVGEKYYLNNLFLSTQYQHDNVPIEETIEIAGGEFRDSKVTRFNEAQRMIIFKEMTNPDIVYEPDFWDQQDRSVPSDVQENLEENAPLPRQFFLSSGKRIIPLPKEFKSYEELYQDQEIFQLFMDGDF